MWPDYEDITSRAGKPDWYQQGGVPRYGEFHPDYMGVYDSNVMLYEIGCQGCEQRFKVAAGFDMMHIFRRPGGLALPSTSKEGGEFHYGDPPRHGCVGDTMNSFPIRVLEYWSKGGSPDYEWGRVSKEEVVWLTDEEVEQEYGR